jgi:NAD(P)H-dependent FMN reductase
MKRIVMINGSPSGNKGNTAIVLTMLSKLLGEKVDVRVIHLTEPRRDDAIVDSLSWAEGFVFATGTYWDSWGSPLQAFFERMTGLEASPVWLGKPAAVIVTMHSVGGKEVASRLQGVLTTLGLMIPPMSSFVYSLANHLALKSPDKNPPDADFPDTDFKEDLWQLQDLEVVGANLLHAVRLATLAKTLAKEKEESWSAWTVDRADPSRQWLR